MSNLRSTLLLVRDMIDDALAADSKPEPVEPPKEQVVVVSITYAGDCASELMNAGLTHFADDMGLLIEELDKAGARSIAVHDIFLTMELPISFDAAAEVLAKISEQFCHCTNLWIYDGQDRLEGYQMGELIDTCPAEVTCIKWIMGDVLLSRKF